MSEYMITFQPMGIRSTCSDSESILQAAWRAGVKMTAVCAGAGYCGKCRVQVVKGSVLEDDGKPERGISQTEWDKGIRLACRTHPRSDLTVLVPAESFDALQRLQVECNAFEMVLQEQKPLLEQQKGMGLAIDLGTTKVAGYLVDLEQGHIVAQKAVPNGQVMYGEDIISRIAVVNEGAQKKRDMRNAAITSINELTHQLCRSSGIHEELIVRAVIAGNTVMQHLLLNLPVQQLGVAPYEPARKEAITLPSDELGLLTKAGTPVYLPPNIAGYIGGDHVAALYATGIFQQKETCIVCDVGTNTEISLLHDGVIRCCSCASGPAFEGAHIHQGMRAATGAIDHVYVKNGNLECNVIGSEKPVGICGSGLIDSVAALLEIGVLSQQGVLNRLDERVIPHEGQVGIWLTDDVMLTQKDISVLQLAKGAIRAGLELLLSDAGIEPSDLQTFILAGAFGSYVDVKSAQRINMIPSFPEKVSVRQIGNAAGLGAVRLLISEKERKIIENQVHGIRHVDLTSFAEFNQILARSMFFTQGG